MTKRHGLGVRLALGCGLIPGAMAVVGGLSPLADAPMAYPSLLAPSVRHWLGTNQLGQDILLQTVLAAPGTMGVCMAAGLCSLGVSLLYASAAATLPPLWGRVLMRVSDAVGALPSIVVAMMVANAVKPGPLVLVPLIAALEWSRDVRGCRAMIEREIHRESYRLARSYGAGRLYLLRRHILPRGAPIVVATGIVAMRRAVMLGAGLAFLGMTDPTLPSWGGMLADAVSLLYDPGAMWMVLGPGTALSLFVLFLTASGLFLERYSRAIQGGHPDSD